MLEQLIKNMKISFLHRIIHDYNHETHFCLSALDTIDKHEKRIDDNRKKQMYEYIHNSIRSQKKIMDLYDNFFRYKHNYLKTCIEDLNLFFNKISIRFTIQDNTDIKILGSNIMNIFLVLLFHYSQLSLKTALSEVHFSIVEENDSLVRMKLNCTFKGILINYDFGLQYTIKEIDGYIREILKTTNSSMTNSYGDSSVEYLLEFNKDEKGSIFFRENYCDILY